MNNIALFHVPFPKSLAKITNEFVLCKYTQFPKIAFTSINILYCNIDEHCPLRKLSNCNDAENYLIESNTINLICKLQS